MEKDKPDDYPNEMDPFLFFAVILGVLALKSDNKDDPEEECKPEY